MGFDDDRVVRDGRTEFFRLAGLPGDGGYTARAIHFRIGRLSFALPSPAARKRAVPSMRTWRAFQRGRSSANFYSSQWDETWLDASLGQLRARLIPETDERPRQGGDVLLFLVHAVPGLTGVIVLTFALVTLALALR